MQDNLKDSVQIKSPQRLDIMKFVTAKHSLNLRELYARTSQHEKENHLDFSGSLYLNFKTIVNMPVQIMSQQPSVL